MMSRLLLSAAVAASLSACVSILPDPAPAPSVYRLDTSAQSVSKISNATIVRVDRPAATQIFNSNNIVVTNDNQKLSTVALAKWSEATPVIIQNAMVDALGSSSQFIGLIPTSGARTETRLHLSVKNFEAKFDNGTDSAPLAVVQYRVTYSRADDRALLGTYTVRETVRAQSINVSSIVAAIEDANDAAMMNIVAWMEKQSTSGRS